MFYLFYVITLLPRALRAAILPANFISLRTPRYATSDVTCKTLLNFYEPDCLSATLSQARPMPSAIDQRVSMAVIA